MNVTRLPNGDDERRRQSAATLRELANQIEDGTALGFVGIVDYPGNTYSTIRSRGANRHERLGILFEALFETLRAGRED